MTNIERLIERLYESKPDKEEYDMKKIINPWKDMEGYNCFGCSPDNEAGVRMEFYEDGDEVVSIWKPRPEYQGWLNTLHGGIQSVLLDEICGWVVFRKLQTGGVTSKMETRFRKSISTNDTHVVLRLKSSLLLLPYEAMRMRLHLRAGITLKEIESNCLKKVRKL